MDEAGIVASIERGRSFGISIDTSVFDRNQLELEGGILGQLRQLKASGIPLVLADVVAMELLAHLEEKASDSLATAKRALRSFAGSWGMSKDEMDELIGELTSGMSPKEVAKSRYDEFVAETGCQIASTSEHGDAVRVLRGYFEGSAPFGGKRERKSEFPDAFALLTLENWAEAQGLKLIAVSADSGWSEFCATSLHLTAADDLGRVLALLHRDERVVAARVWAALQPGSDNWSYIRDEVVRQLDRLEIGGTGDSEYLLELQTADVGLEGFEIVQASETSGVELVNAREDRVVARVAATLSLEARFRFDFYKPQVGGQRRARVGRTERRVAFDAAVELLVTIKTDTAAPKAIRVELSPVVKSVHCGFLEPDRLHDG